jgi:outer membrane protein TolC
MNKNCIVSFVVLAVCLAMPLFLVAQDVQTLTLKQAVDTALRNSHEVALAKVRYNVAQNTASVTRSAFRPNLYTGSGAEYTYGFPQTPGGAAPSVVNLGYIQTVFDPLRSAQARADDQRTEVQRLELEKTRNTIMLQASSAYLELGKVRHALDLTRSQRLSNGRILEFTRRRLAEGLELPIEVKRAELAAARTEQKIVQLESRESNLQRQLATLMALPPEARIEVSTETIEFGPNQRERDLVDRAIATNLDLQQSERERRAKEQLLAGQIGTKWPSVDLVGQYGFFAKYNNFEDYFQKFQHNNLNVGVQVKIPLMSAQRSANVALARTELTAVEAELTNMRQTIELEVGRQYQRLREVDAAREVARLELELAQENLKVVQAGFQEGRVNLRDVERARLDESEKWLGFLDSDYDRQKAQLDLLNTTGDLGRLLQ